MLTTFGIAVSGLNAAARRVDISARNVVNTRSVGTPPATADARAASAAYEPFRVADTSIAPGGVEARVEPLVPASHLSYEPDQPAAGGDGLVEAPNVDLAAETAQQIVARTSFAANLKTVQTADGMLKTLLDLKA